MTGGATVARGLAAQAGLVAALAGVGMPMPAAAQAQAGAPAQQAVRAPSARLVPQGPWVYDRKTDLTWQRCTLGQVWDGQARCTGEPRRVSFPEARQLQAEGWRVPTLDELASLVVPGRMPTIDPVAFPDTPPLYFWATDNRDLTAAWYVFFENGKTNHYYPPHTNRDLLRLVRSGRYTGPSPAALAASAASASPGPGAAR